MGTSRNQSFPWLAWGFTFFFILVVSTQVSLNLIYNTSSTPLELILFNGLITLISLFLALFQTFAGGMQGFFTSLRIPGSTTFLRNRAVPIFLSLLFISLSSNFIY